MGQAHEAQQASGQRFTWRADGTALWAGVDIPKRWLWDYFREQLTSRPEYVAKMTGIASLVNLPNLPAPAEPLKLADLLALYLEQSESHWRTKGQVKSAFRRLLAITEAKTLSDLTTEALIGFREAVTAYLAPTGAQAVFGKIKIALAFARKFGRDAEQITNVLARAKVLYAPKAHILADPKPIAKTDFHKLLNAADTRWRAILLLGLNLAMYAEDICTLQWSDFDLEARNLCGPTGKDERGASRRAVERDRGRPKGPTPKGTLAAALH